MTSFFARAIPRKPQYSRDTFAVNITRVNGDEDSDVFAYPRGWQFRDGYRQIISNGQEEICIGTEIKRFSPENEYSYVYNGNFKRDAVPCIDVQHHSKFSDTDWSLVEVSQNGEMLVAPTLKSGNLRVCELDWVSKNISWTRVVRTPDGSPFRGGLLFADQKALIVCHEGQISVYEFEIGLWHSVLNLNRRNEQDCNTNPWHVHVEPGKYLTFTPVVNTSDQAYEFHAMLSGRFIRVSVDLKRPIGRKSSLKELKNYYPESDKLFSECEVVHFDQEDCFVILIRYGPSNGGGGLFSQVYSSKSGFSEPVKIEEGVASSGSQYAIGRASGGIALVTSNIVDVFSLDDGQLSFAYKWSLNEFYDGEVSQYHCYDFWGVVQRTLQMLVEKFSGSKESVGIICNPPNILNAYLSNRNEILRLYLKLTDSIVNWNIPDSWYDNPPHVPGDGKYEMYCSAKPGDDPDRELTLSEMYDYIDSPGTGATHIFRKILANLEFISTMFDRPEIEAEANEKKPDRNDMEVDFDSYFSWPSTDASPSYHGIDDTDPTSWPKEGVLMKMGYSVSKSKGISSDREREALLALVVRSPRLPFVQNREHMLEWGPASSCARLKKTANVLASFARTERRRGFVVPLRRREHDLAYLKRTFYDGSACSRNFSWPSSK